jgi:hypothetical protein
MSLLRDESFRHETVTGCRLSWCRREPGTILLIPFPLTVVRLLVAESTQRDSHETANRFRRGEFPSQRSAAGNCGALQSSAACRTHDVRLIAWCSHHVCSTRQSRRPNMRFCGGNSRSVHSPNDRRAPMFGLGTGAQGTKTPPVRGQPVSHGSYLSTSGLERGAHRPSLTVAPQWVFHGRDVCVAFSRNERKGLIEHEAHPPAKPGAF